MAGRVEFDVTLGRNARRHAAGEPMRILLLADFSGTGGTRSTPLAQRPARPVDGDSLDVAIGRMAAAIRHEEAEIAFSSLDHFHPDQIYARVERFRGLHTSGLTAPAPGESDDVTRLLGKRSEPSPTPPDVTATGLDALIRHIVAPHVVKEPSAEARIHLEAVHSALAGEMRALLHDPAFQRLEATWRSVAWLISRLELGEHVQLSLFDVTRAELLDDLATAGGAFRQTAAYKALVERQKTGGNEVAGWSHIVALETFGWSAEDVAVLAFLGELAASGGGTLLAGADHTLMQAVPAAFMALRRTDTARSIELAAPRILLRLPYGRASDPIESFPFEECPGPPEHDDLLWGSGAIGIAFLRAIAYATHEREWEPGDEREIDDLPAYTFVRDGERELQPCAERLLTESEINELLASGFTPVVSRRDRNSVMLPRLQSIAEPSTASS